MRFARVTIFLFIVSVLGTGPTPLWAQTAPPPQPSPAWRTSDLSQTSENNFSVRLQTGKNTSTLKAGAGLVFETLTHGLGSISALTMDKNGTLYATDRDAGRVWRLRDRNQDGKFETTQALPQRFDEPSGLAVHGGKIFIADRNAVWVMTGIEPPEKLAGLLNSGSKGLHHPLSISPDGQTLYLGLSTHEGEAELLSLKVKTGKATLVQKIVSDQDIIDIAVFGKGSPWLALEHGVGASLDTLVELSPSQTLSALALPLRASASRHENWPDAFANHIFVSRLSSDGYDVLALPVGLGQVNSLGKIIFSGFLSSSGRSAWGRPGPLFLDTNGLIISDSKNGDLYRLKNAPAQPISEDPKDSGLVSAFDAPTTKPGPLMAPPEMQVSTITEGSQIGSVSKLKRGSTLDVGSTIIEDYEPLSLDKDGEDKFNADKDRTKNEKNNSSRGHQKK